MGGVFSRKAKPPPPPAAPREVVLSPQEESMLQLKRQRDKVTKFGDRLFKEAEVCTRKAREAVAKNDRSAAERFIKMRMLKNKRREQVLAQLSNLESLVAAVETAAQTKAVFSAMEAGNAVLKRYQEEMPIDAVERVMDDTAEALAHIAAVDAVLTRELGTDTSSQDALEAQLLALEEEVPGAEGAAAPARVAPAAPAAAKARRGSGARAAPAVAELPAVPTRVLLPEVPSGPVAKQRVAVPA